MEDPPCLSAEAVLSDLNVVALIAMNLSPLERARAMCVRREFSDVLRLEALWKEISLDTRAFDGDKKEVEFVLRYMQKTHKVVLGRSWIDLDVSNLTATVHVVPESFDKWFTNVMLSANNPECRRLVEFLFALPQDMLIRFTVNDSSVFLSMAADDIGLNFMYRRFEYYGTSMTVYTTFEMIRDSPEFTDWFASAVEKVCLTENDSGNTRGRLTLRFEHTPAQNDLAENVLLETYEDFVRAWIGRNSVLENGVRGQKVFVSFGVHCSTFTWLHIASDNYDEYEDEEDLGHFE